MTQTAPLGEVIRYLRGVTFKPEDKVTPESSNAVVCMRTKNIQDVLDERDLIAIPRPLVRRPELFLHENDILISSANSWNLVGKVCRVPRLSYAATAGGFISIVRATPSVEPRYLFRWLGSSEVQENIRACARQTTNIANLSVEQFEELQIPLPSLAEQRRIADILDKADAIRRKRKEAIALTDDLLRSAFLEMFGDPVSNPKGWPIRALGELATEMRYGTSEKCLGPQPGALPVLRIPNVVGGRVDVADLKYATLAVAEVERLRLRRGDLVFVRSNGNPDYIARCAVYDRDEEALFASYLIRVRVRPEVLPTFVQATLETPSYRGLLTRSARTTAGNFNISTEGLRALKIPVPPIELQLRFERARSKGSLQRRRKAHALADAERLFDALVHRAFRGELTSRADAGRQLSLLDGTP